MKNKNSEKSKPSKDKLKFQLVIQTLWKEFKKFREKMKNSLKNLSLNYKNHLSETVLRKRKIF